MRRTICSGLSLLVIFTVSVPAQRQRSSNPPSPVSDQSRSVKLVEADPQNSLEQRMAYLSQQISREMSENQKHTIAVVEFVDLRGNITDFGRFLAEELITRLYQTKKFKVIERQLLNKVITEQKLSLTGLIDQTSAQRLGQLLGVDAIASGTITDLDKNLRINARLINTGTGEIFAVASTEIFKDAAVMNLMGVGLLLPASDTNLKSSTSAPIKKVPQKVTLKDFTLELIACKIAGQTVTCNFTITNNSSEDKNFWLSRAAGWQGENSARMFDNLGNEYLASGAQLGSRVHNSSHIYLGIVIVPQVSTKAVLKFENVSLEATTIKLLRVAFEIGTIDLAGRAEFLFADFRDVPITR